MQAVCIVYPYDYALLKGPEDISGFKHCADCVVPGEQIDKWRFGRKKNGVAQSSPSDCKYDSQFTGAITT